MRPVITLRSEKTMFLNKKNKVTAQITSEFQQPLMAIPSVFFVFFLDIKIYFYIHITVCASECKRN